jgi:hypothetical protein
MPIILAAAGFIASVRETVRIIRMALRTEEKG